MLPRVRERVRRRPRPRLARLLGLACDGQGRAASLSSPSTHPPFPTHPLVPYASTPVVHDARSCRSPSHSNTQEVAAARTQPELQQPAPIRTCSSPQPFQHPSLHSPGADVALPQPASRYKSCPARHGIRAEYSQFCHGFRASPLRLRRLVARHHKPLQPASSKQQAASSKC